MPGKVKGKEKRGPAVQLMDSVTEAMSGNMKGKVRGISSLRKSIYVDLMAHNQSK